MNLNPALWRTCRILLGKMRLSLLRRVAKRPGQTVSQLAEAEGISRPRASQELRRLQSRGLLRADRKGRFLIYQLIPDPQVASAKPILQAMCDTFSRFPPSADEQTIRIAAGLSHARRIAIVRQLRKGSCNVHGLQNAVQIPFRTLSHHLRLLHKGGWVQREGRDWELAPNDFPLAKCLMELL
jgi:DNA-binding transcriptional ArsR family regulator